ncbi:MAG TPA: hydrogen gas-evolving membrane-bound hydrogenase subunit E [Acidimicrobiales bacterium]
MVGGRRLGRRALLLAGVGPAAAVGWALGQAGDVLDGGVVTERTQWVGELGLAVDLRLDGFGLLMLALVSGIGVLVFAYAWRYFGSPSAALGRLAGLLGLFAGAMFGLVVADNLLVLYVCWELTSITSYLLIGNADRDPEARSAALHALLVTGAGGLAMLGGFVLLGQAAGTYRLSALVADPPAGGTVTAGLVLVLVGAFTKSAQYPFHSWLPAAMVAPTPISAYLHSAAMVKAGVYLIARLAPAFAAVGPWRPLVATVGLVTMVAGGLRALRPTDLKQLLAFGTVSQLGFLVVLVGVGRPEATVAGCALLLAHGLFKAALFMVVGIVDHQAGTRDVREIGPLGAGWGPTKAVAVVAAASMAGLPPLAGFLSKEAAYEAFVHGGTGDRVILAGLVVGSMLTVAYSLRFVAALVRAPEPGPRPEAAERVGANGRPEGEPATSSASSTPAAAAPAERAPAPAPAGGFLAPAAVLAAATFVLGVAPSLLSELVDAGAHTLDAAAHAHLRLWHGVTATLGLTALTLAGGALLYAARRPVATVQAVLAPQPTGADVYQAVLRGVTRTADMVTGVAQPGSLPLYISVIVLTAALVPGAGLVLGTWWPGWPDVIGEIAYLPAVGLLVGGAVASALATRRFTAALLLGVVGYGMALLFVVLGAPDLALTQFAIETLSVVLFLLVLRRLPDRFERRTPVPRQLVRAGVAATVAAFVFVLAIAAPAARTDAPVSGEMVERAEPDAGGRNVVNVILVDMRGLDTLGEITVLATAAVGATAVARVGRRPRSETEEP